MATTRGTSGNLVQTRAVTISHADFQTVSDNTSQVIDILVPSSSDSTAYQIRNVIAFVREAWAATAPAIKVGDDGDDDGYTTLLSGGSAGIAELNSGAYVTPASIVPTGEGSNTGTSGSGLSLIGDTTSVNQASNLMNDLIALQEDIAALDTTLANSAGSLSGPLKSYTGGNGVKATVTLGSGSFASKVAGEFLVLVEYIDLSAL